MKKKDQSTIGYDDDDDDVPIRTDNIDPSMFYFTQLLEKFADNTRYISG